LPRGGVELMSRQDKALAWDKGGVIVKEFVWLIRNEIDHVKGWSPEQHRQFLKKCEPYIGGLKREGPVPALFNGANLSPFFLVTLFPGSGEIKFSTEHDCPYLRKAVRPGCRTSGEVHTGRFGAERTGRRYDRRPESTGSGCAARVLLYGRPSVIFVAADVVGCALGPRDALEVGGDFHQCRSGVDGRRGRLEVIVIGGSIHEEGGEVGAKDRVRIIAVGTPRRQGDDALTFY